MPTISSLSGFRKTVPCGSTISPPKSRCSFVMAFSSPLFRTRRIICSNMGSRMPPGDQMMSLDRRLLMLDKFPAVIIGAIGRGAEHAIGWAVLAPGLCPVAEDDHGSLRPGPGPARTGVSGRRLGGLIPVAPGCVGILRIGQRQYARVHLHRIPAWRIPQTLNDRSALEDASTRKRHDALRVQHPFEELCTAQPETLLHGPDRGLIHFAPSGRDAVPGVTPGARRCAMIPAWSARGATMRPGCLASGLLKSRSPPLPSVTSAPASAAISAPAAMSHSQAGRNVSMVSNCPAATRHMRQASDGRK